MKQEKLMDAHIQVRRIYNLLGEVQDLSRQLAEAVDRDDQVTVRMLLAMREEPVQALGKARDALKHQIEGSGPEDAARLKALLNGGPPLEEAEKGLADQVAANARLLKQVQETDKILNLKITRDKSLYQNKNSSSPK